MIAVMRLMKRMNEGSVDKSGDEAYFFRAVKSECNGYRITRLTSRRACAYNRIGL